MRGILENNYNNVVGKFKNYQDIVGIFPGQDRKCIEYENSGFLVK
jgi:hypothetical protein